MLSTNWPLFDLKITTPVLEIRVPRDEDLDKLLLVTDEGIHDRASMPFLNPWTDLDPNTRRQTSLQWWWGQRARWSVDNWSLTGAVFVNDELIGVQDLAAENFAVLRSVTTGSWLGQKFQGRGYGKEMRQAILHLAFEGLDAVEAHSGAFWDNAASLGTSRSLGYQDNGTHLTLRRGQPDRQQLLVLTRDQWLTRRRSDITISGLENALSMFVG